MDSGVLLPRLLGLVRRGDGGWRDGTLTHSNALPSQGKRDVVCLDVVCLVALELDALCIAPIRQKRNAKGFVRRD